MRIIFLRKEYLSLLPSMIASLFSANGVAAAIDLCGDMISKRVVTPAGKAFQALRGSGVSPMGNGWFSDMTNNASGGAVFLQQGAEFTLSPENETGMTLFANNTVSGEYNNGGAIFAKENSTLNLTDVIFLVTSQAAMVAQSILLVLTIPVPSIYVSLTPCFAITSLMTAKVVQFIPSIMISI